MNYHWRSRLERPFCGASLITPEWLVTAAHCIASLSPRRTLPVGRAFKLSDWLYFGLKLRLGDNNREEVDDYETEIKVKKIIIHPDYQPQKPEAGFDVALLKLSRSVKFSKQQSL